MSHIRRETVTDVTGVSPELLEQGVRIAGQLLELQGVVVRDGFYNYDTYVRGVDYHDSSNRVVLGLDPEGYGRSGKFGGLGVGIDASGKLVFLGTSEQWDGRQANQARQTKLQHQMEQVLPGAVYLAARLALAHAQGKAAQLVPNPKTRQLALAVEA